MKLQSTPKSHLVHFDHARYPYMSLSHVSFGDNHLNHCNMEKQ